MKFKNTLKPLVAALVITGYGSLANASTAINLANISNGGVAIQSTTYSWPANSGVAAKAIDGITNGVGDIGNITHTQLEYQPWWQVDLGGVSSRIRNINIWNRTDCCAERLNGFDVIVYNAGQVVWSSLNNSYTQALPVASFSLPANIVGDTVKIKLEGANYLSLAEVQVWSPPVPTNVNAYQSQLKNVRVGDIVTASNTLSNTGAAGTILTGTARGELWVGSMYGSYTGHTDTSIGSINLVSNASQAYSFSNVINTPGSYGSLLKYNFDSGLYYSGGYMDASYTYGGAYNAAQATINTTSLAFGNVREGTTRTGTFQVSNTAAAGDYTERLSSSLSVNNANASLSASDFTGIVAGGTAGTETVTFNTTGTGTKTSVITIANVSSGTGTSGLADLALGSNSVSVTGTVYALANPVVQTSPVTFAGRVGDTLGTQAIFLTNQSADGYREGLNASVSTSATPFNASGSIANLAAQGSDASSLRVGVSTATSGSFTGNANVALASTGAGTTNAADYGLASQAVGLVAHIYEAARTGVENVLVNFGIVHKGDTVTRNLTVSNDASGALNDALVTSLDGMAGPFSAVGGPGALAAGRSGDWQFDLDTSADGTYSLSALLQSLSHNGEMADLALADIGINFAGQVNNWASASFDMGGGATLTRVGNDFVIDFGTVHRGSGIHSATFGIDNIATGLADWLGIDFTGDANDFQASGLADFTGLGNADLMHQLIFGLDSSRTGAVQNTLSFTAQSGNASGIWSLGDYTLTVRGNVVEDPMASSNNSVPEPGSLALIGLALFLLVQVRRYGKPAVH